jgi:hypothetical protein
MESRASSSGPWATLFSYGWRILLPAALFMLAALVLAELRDVHATDLLRDTTALLDGPGYTGFFSTAGIALWAASAAMCLLALSTHDTGDAKRLLLAGAVASLVLGIDDAYLGHETIKNTIGIPSIITIGAYGLMVLYLFWRSREHLMKRPDLIILVAGVVMLALSVLLDAAGEADLPTPPLSEIFEDVFKFLGIVTWTSFFGRVARGAVMEPHEREVETSV